MINSKLAHVCYIPREGNYVKIVLPPLGYPVSNIPIQQVYPFPLTHCRLNELPHSIYWKILISILGMLGNVI